jgi:hypothetical protein
MAQQGYHRISHDHLAAFSQKLQEEPWGKIDITPYTSAKDHLAVPILPLIKLRLLQKSSKNKRDLLGAWLCQ